MRNFTEMFRDEPDRFLRRHPVQAIEPGETYRTRISPQGALAAHVEIDIEITHGQLAQAAIDRLAITAAGEIGFCHCAPVAAHLENRNHVVGILFCFQIENEWWKTQHTQRCRSENSALKTGGRAIV